MTRSHGYVCTRSAATGRSHGSDGGGALPLHAAYRLLLDSYLPFLLAEMTFGARLMAMYDGPAGGAALPAASGARRRIFFSGIASMRTGCC